MPESRDRPKDPAVTSSVRLNPDLPFVEVVSRASWRTWLVEHHQRSSGVWAVTIKKTSVPIDGIFVSATDLNEECLCFGWIDSKPARIDERRSALLCTPRKPGSGWSKVNKQRLTKLLADGLVTPAGLRAIETAKADGSWTKLDAVDALVVPVDLAAALARLADARTHFDTFPPSARRGILEWIDTAKTQATRTKRIDETARLAAQNIRANQWRPRDPG